MKTLKRFFYRIDGQGYPIPGTLQRWKEQPKIGQWKELEFSNVCCIEPGVGCQDVADRTVLSNIFNTTDIADYNLALIHDASAIYTYVNADLTNVIDQFDLVYFGIADFTVIDLGGGTAQIQMIFSSNCAVPYSLLMTATPN